MRMLIMIGCMVVGLGLPASWSFAGGPNRPLELTAEQYARLQQLQAEPVHEAMEEVHASYSSEHEERIEIDRVTNDITTGMWQATYPVVITILLVAASPL